MVETSKPWRLSGAREGFECYGNNANGDVNPMVARAISFKINSSFAFEPKRSKRESGRIARKILHA